MFFPKVLGVKLVWGPAVSLMQRCPCGNMFAVTTTSGGRHIFVFDWTSLVEISRFFADPNAPKWSEQTGKNAYGVYGVEWSTDSKRIFIGYAWPIVGIHEWQTGELVYAIEGNLHFQIKLIVGPQNQLAATLMDDYRIYDDEGKKHVPNSLTLLGGEPLPATVDYWLQRMRV